MGIQRWSENVVLVNLGKEPVLGEELQGVIDIANKSGDIDVVVDFADVDILSSSSIAKLLKLRKVLMESSHQLILSTVDAKTMNIFTVTGLEGVFEFVEDQFFALAGLQMAL